MEIFYDALAGGSDDLTADPAIARIAHELVTAIREDLSVDWADRESTEAKIRTKIQRLLRKHKYRQVPKAGGGGAHDLDGIAGQVLDQARVLYRYWPEVGAGEAALF